MPFTILRQTVTDFPRWRRAFEEQAEARQAAGSRGGHIFRRADDRQEVVVFLAWSDLEAARRYLDSDAVRSGWQAVGVGGETEVLYLEELGRPSR